jgi:hypothetical protein
MTIAKAMGAFMVTLATAGALLLAGCPKGNVAALMLTPREPVVGDTLTIVFEHETKGFFHAQDGLYAISLSSPRELMPEVPPPSQLLDAEFKLGDMVVVNGHGEFRTVLQPSYGPDQYGMVLRLEPGIQIGLEIRGPQIRMRRSLPIGRQAGHGQVGILRAHAPGAKGADAGKRGCSGT